MASDGKPSKFFPEPSGALVFVALVTTTCFVVAAHDVLIGENIMSGAIFVLLFAEYPARMADATTTREEEEVVDLGAAECGRIAA